MRFCTDRQDALDVLQETFTYFFKKFPGFILTCQLKTFLYPVVKNLSISIIRKRKPTEVFDQHSSPLAATQERNLQEEKDNLADSIAHLNEEHREVIMLRFGESLSLEEISQTLEIPKGTVKSRLHNALNKLKHHFS